MNKESFEEYCDRYIKFYRDIKLNGWSAKELCRLVIRNMHNIKNKGMKCIKEASKITEVEV